ncbi:MULTISPECIES: hypothetical protein [unclassified Streptomyces]|uniref:hypothetical protein n=1 Tax=unclassified Streptomyces TaxID=2593676 RepID=UPI00093AF3A5|nr:hypothetical protein [Streptomyces sp. TSRI0281]OKI48130.1 hypothetical protein A6A29_03510 [Streptomyces sp. TSRI0281]
MTTTRTVRRVCVAFASVAALTSVAACSGSDDAGGTGKDGTRAGGVVKGEQVAALRQVQEKTGGAKSAKVEGTTVMGTNMSMTQSGVIDWSKGLTGSLKITYTGGTMGDALKKSGGDGSMEARYLKDEYYANMGDAFAANIGGKHWVRYAYKDLAELSGASGGVMKDQMESSTPEQGVKALLASGDVKKVGQEDVRGVPTTHYSGTVDVAELTAKNGALDEAQLAALKKQLDQAGITTETVDIWVDKNDLLVKKTERGQMKTGELNTTVYYSDYGTAVAVEKPPAADTADFADILKQQQGAAAGAGAGAS